MTATAIHLIRRSFAVASSAALVVAARTLGAAVVDSINDRLDITKMKSPEDLRK